MPQRVMEHMLVNPDDPQPEPASAGDDAAAFNSVVAPDDRSPGRVFATILVAVAAVGWLLYLLATHDALGDAWTTQVMLCLVALLAAAWGAIHRHHHWTLPQRRLREQVRRVLRGEASIESLSDIGGGPAGLVPLIQEVLRELRQQKLANAAREAELRQRAASRTGALERTIESLRHQATRDALTGLFNRRFLDTFLPQAVQKCLAAKAELCVLMMDVDHFKKLNDTLGHTAGDALLKSIGQIIRSTARGEDVPFRFGGDEFIVLMLGSGEKAGRALADRLTSLVDSLCKTYHITPRPRLSVGVAPLASLENPTVETLLVEADRRLYAVKAGHKAEERERPRTVVHVTSAPGPVSTAGRAHAPATGHSPASSTDH